MNGLPSLRLLPDAPRPGRSHRTPRPPVSKRSTGHESEPGTGTFIPTTNSIESLNARYRRAVKARGHFPTEQAALKCLYLTTRALDPTGRGRARWAMRWKPALNAFAITFEGRLVPSTTN